MKNTLKFGISTLCAAIFIATPTFSFADTPAPVAPQSQTGPAANGANKAANEANKAAKQSANKAANEAANAANKAAKNSAGSFAR